MRARAKLPASCAGQLCGRCSLIIVFISTTRAATSASFSRSVPNWALRHRDPEAPHQPIGSGVQEQPERVGRRLRAGGAAGGQMGLP